MAHLCEFHQLLSTAGATALHAEIQLITHYKLIKGLYFFTFYNPNDKKFH